MKKTYSKTVGFLLTLCFVGSILLICTGAYSFYRGIRISGILQLVIGAFILVQSFVMQIKRQNDEKNYMSLIVDNQLVTSGNVLNSFPLPMCVLHVAGDIIWFNEKLTEMLKNNELYGVNIEKVIPSLKWGTVIQSGKIERNVECGGKHYLMFGRIMSSTDKDDNDTDKYTVYLYFVDKTKEIEVTRRYLEERYDVAVLNIDNYDYILQKSEDGENQNILYTANQYISAWVKESGGILKKTDRDKYFALFEHKHLDKYIENRFDIVNKFRSLSDSTNVPFSITIGIGTGGNVVENENGARTALDLAIGRGGDMVAVKDSSQYKFYASKIREYDKSTKAKARASAVAIKNFIKNVDKVIIMGHVAADFDCFGAAMGLQRAVRDVGVTPYLVCENMAAVDKMFSLVKEMPEYESMFITPEYSLEIVDKQTLVIIVDTHRPGLIPAPGLLNKTDKIVMIDHHRRSTDFITPVSLTYHEPSASSTCEMVTELLQYMNTGDTLTKIEAQCLYMGILMDTKNFIIKTGVRTFEAASYLRRNGLDTVAVKQMFAVEKTEYDIRTEIVRNMEYCFENIGISILENEYDNVRVVASQAADEMLNIDKIEASFVLYPNDVNVCISGRSLGEVNVQEILEMLGGGGHSTVAGAQLKNKTFEEVKEELVNAIGTYLSASDERGNTQ